VGGKSTTIRASILKLGKWPISKKTNLEITFAEVSKHTKEEEKMTKKKKTPSVERMWDGCG